MGRYSAYSSRHAHAYNNMTYEINEMPLLSQIKKPVDAFCIVNILKSNIILQK